MQDCLQLYKSVNMYNAKKKSVCSMFLDAVHLKECIFKIDTRCSALPLRLVFTNLILNLRL